MRKGFTLVELSIVLVIIGLLIGGILTAQSMISTAKISAQVRQIGQFDAMVLNFKTKFNYLPGDAPAFGGDGDGVIDATAICCGGVDNALAAFTGEIGNFWHDLDPQQFPGMAIYVQPGTMTETNGSSKNVPLSKIGIEGSYVMAQALSIDSGFADITNKSNYYAILTGSQAHSIAVDGWFHFTPTTSSNSAVRPSDSLALDAKMDDGLANSGNIISGAIGSYNGQSYGGIVASPISTCSSGAAYQIQNAGYECTPLIRIGGSVGVPQ